MKKTTLAAATTLALSLLSGSVMAAPLLEPTTQHFIDSLAGSTPIYKMTPTAARNVLASAQANPTGLLSVDIEDKVLPVGPKGSTNIRVIRPHGATGTLPVIIYFHGAGWVMGDKSTHDRLVRQLAVGSHATLVFVDYSRSPENRYPVAVEEDYAVTKYVAEHAAEFNIDASKLAVAGDSVGGNMTAVVTLLAKERKTPAITAQLLFYPVTSANFNNGSYNEFANGPWLTRDGMKWFWNQYEPNIAKRADPHLSPLNASLEQLKGLPQALVITDENDVLRDEGEAYARKLTQAGVRVTSTRYNGTIHDFVMLNALGQTPAAISAVAQATQFLSDTLHPAH